MSLNKAAVFAVFNDADNSSASFADRLLALGIGDRATARPLALEWASKKYAAPLENGKLPRNSAAERAAYRVLSVCFPSVDLPAKSGRAHAKSAVEKLLAAYEKLSAGEKRSFKARIA